LENLVTGISYLDGFQGTRVLVTGHTGFKGAWLATWLKDLGAEVTGFALAPKDGRPSLFSDAAVADGMTSILGDLKDESAVQDAVQQAQPQIVFHLAAQALVRRSYRDPTETFATNLLGTVHVLEACRRVRGLKAVVVITSDKCYENDEQAEEFKEDDPLGGCDPYSASKACAELATHAYQRSFFSEPGNPLVATTRAGNVIGGGDWAEDRLVPDIARGIATQQPVVIRNPDSVRPWQQVLEPLRGYLMLGARLMEGERAFAEAWNFGPNPEDIVSVKEIAARIIEAWGEGGVETRPDPGAPAEAGRLYLNIEKAAERLDYRPVLDLNGGIGLTVDWYRAYRDDPSMARDLTRRQIKDYTERLC
jgi:CDP-glucose 4,6-dehydratase